MKPILLPSFKICAVASIAFTAIILQLFFLWYISGDQYHAVTQMHGHIGYSLYKYNTIWMSPTLYACAKKHGNPNAPFDYNNVRNIEFNDFIAPFSINDTIGYGVVLGLLWKITGSLNYHDMQILQILLYLVSLFLIYRIALMFFANTAIAWATVIAHLFFFPIIALNVVAVRDIWAYYGTVLLLYGILTFLHTEGTLVNLLACSIGIAVCQWIRPTIFLPFILVIGVLIFLACMRTYSWSRILMCTSCLLITNVVVFWIPFVTYNKIAYNRLMVGPVGQDLLEGLGEFENPWGFKLDDAWIGAYIGNNYGLNYGTPEFDDKAKELFSLAYTQNPAFYWKSVIKRFFRYAILPGLEWLPPSISPFQGISDWNEKLRLIFSSSTMAIQSIFRLIYSRLFLLIGYVGMAIALYRKKYKAIIFTLAIMLGGLGKLPSHIEYRYLVPFYWVFSLFVGYAIVRLHRNKKS